MGRARQSGRTASSSSNGSSLVLYQDLSRSRLERIRKTFSRKCDPFLCNAVLQKSLCYIRTTPRVSLVERKKIFSFFSFSWIHLLYLTLLYSAVGLKVCLCLSLGDEGSLTQNYLQTHAHVPTHPDIYTYTP